VLVLLAGLALYIDGVVLTYVGLVQPGVPTLVAAAYLLLAVIVPVWLGRRMYRRGSSARRSIAACAGLTLGVSIAFFPIAALAMAM